MSFWESPQANLIIGLLSNLGYGAGAAAWTKTIERVGSRAYFEGAAEALRQRQINISADDLARWFNDNDDSHRRSMLSTTPEGRALAVRSFTDQFGDALSRTDGDEAIGILVVHLATVDNAGRKEILRQLRLEQQVGELRDDLGHVLEMILTAIYQRDPSTPVSVSEPRDRTVRCWAPRPPTSMIHRPKLVDQIIGQLTDRQHEIVAINSVRGAGGTGKTLLAQAIAHDERVISAFPGGVYWSVVGDAGSDATTRVHHDLYRQVTGRTPAAASGVGVLLMEELLDAPTHLLVLDDIWDADLLGQLLRGAPPNMRVLVTTRGVATGGAVIRVDAMTEDESVEMLTRGSEVGAAARHSLVELANALGRWALLLDLAGSELRFAIRGPEDLLLGAIGGIMSDFRGDPTVLDDPLSRDRSLRRVVERSLLRLGDLRPMFESLAVFPADSSIPLDLLMDLWGVARTRAQIVAQALDSTGLVEFRQQSADVPPYVELHDLIVALLHSSVGEVGSIELADHYLRMSRAIKECSTPTPTHARWMHFVLLHAGDHAALLELASREWARIFRSTTYSDVAFLDGWRYVSRELAGLAFDDASRVGVVARLAEVVVLQQVRYAPTLAIAALAMLGQENEAIGHAAELLSGDTVEALHSLLDVDGVDVQRIADIALGGRLATVRSSELLCRLAERLIEVDPALAVSLLHRCLQLSERLGVVHPVSIDAARLLASSDPALATTVVEEYSRSASVLPINRGQRALGLLRAAACTWIEADERERLLASALVDVSALSNRQGELTMILVDALEVGVQLGGSRDELRRAMVDSLSTIDDVFGARGFAALRVATSLRESDPAVAQRLWSAACKSTTTTHNLVGDRGRLLAGCAKFVASDRPEVAASLFDDAVASSVECSNEWGARAGLLLDLAADQIVEGEARHLIDAAVDQSATLENTYGERSKLLVRAATLLIPSDPARGREILSDALEIADLARDRSVGRDARLLSLIRRASLDLDPTDSSRVADLRAIVDSLDYSPTTRARARSQLALGLGGADPVTSLALFEQALQDVDFEADAALRARALAEIAIAFQAVAPDRCEGVLKSATEIAIELAGPDGAQVRRFIADADTASVEGGERADELLALLPLGSSLAETSHRSESRLEWVESVAEEAVRAGGSADLVIRDATRPLLNSVAVTTGDDEAVRTLVDLAVELRGLDHSLAVNIMAETLNSAATPESVMSIATALVDSEDAALGDVALLALRTWGALRSASVA